MNTLRKFLITKRCISFVSLISLSSFAANSMADQDIVFHSETEAACSEATMTKEMYRIIPDVVDSSSKGPCPLINSKGKEKFGGCKALSGDGVVWYYDMPSFYGANFKDEIKDGCAEWVPVES